MPPILEITNLTKKFDNFALEDLSLSLEEGFIMGIVGPNGSGKTTLIKLILGLLRKDSGSIKIFGRSLESDEITLKQKIGFVLDAPGWYDDLRIREMVGIISSFYTDWDSFRFSQYLKRFEIDPEQKFGKLSKGTKMKCSLAVALSHKARLIIMDEPTSGLDPVVRIEVLEILQQLIAEERRSILFSSHISSDIEKIADYISFINNGKIVFSESRETISDRYSIVKGSADFLDRDTELIFDAIRRKNSRFTALCTKSEMFETTFADQLKTGRIISEKASIDDIIYHIVKGEKNAQPGI